MNSRANWSIPALAVMLASAFACGGDDAPAEARAAETDTPASGKADLPNSGPINSFEKPFSTYSLIGEVFADQGFDLQVDRAAIAPIWPLRERETAVLNRFGTPMLALYHNSDGSQRVDAYVHAGLDITRADVATSDEVLAPVSGHAIVFHWSGASYTPGYNDDPYYTGVIIRDRVSGALVALYHVAPTQALITSGGREVEAGEAVGRLARMPWIHPDHEERFRHSHVVLMDAGAERALNPMRYFPYQDSIRPFLEGAYILDEEAQRHDALVEGPIDVVVEVYDRDDFNTRNFEVESIAYRVMDDRGEMLIESERCRFADTMDEYDDVEESLRFIDFGSALHQIGRGWAPNADFDDPMRTARYALTQFYADPSGHCRARLDSEGHISVDAGVEALTIEVELWDHNDNRGFYTAVIPR